MKSRGIEVSMVMIAVVAVMFVSIIGRTRHVDHLADLHARSVAALSLQEPSIEASADIDRNGVGSDAARQQAHAAHPEAEIVDVFLAEVVEGVARLVWVVVLEHALATGCSTQTSPCSATSPTPLVDVYDAHLGTALQEQTL